MNSAKPPKADFDQRYQTHLKHLKLKSLQPKTIDAYARAIRKENQLGSDPDCSELRLF